MMHSAIPPGARVAFEDEKGRTFFETFDDTEGSQTLPFYSTLVPWSDDAATTYAQLVRATSNSRRVSETRGATNEVDDDDDDASPPEIDTDACLSLAAYLGELGVADGAHARAHASTVPEPEGRRARDESSDARAETEPPSDFFSAEETRVARTLAALAPEIELETSSKQARRSSIGPEPRGGVNSKRRYCRTVTVKARLETSNVAPVIGAAEVRTSETVAAAGDEKKKKLAVLVSSPPFERRHTLKSILSGTPEALIGDAQKRLVCFQMASGLAQLHAACVSFGGRLDASDVVIYGAPASPFVELDPASLFSDRVSDSRDSKELVTKSLAHATEAWRVRAMSTLEYLIVVNANAGRFRGRRDRHAVVPWVADFSENPDLMLRDASKSGARYESTTKGWRDLEKTKWRLTKGDAQLDFSFEHANPKHHVSDECLCETTTCVYLARQTPVSELRRRVRRRFVANEYPSTVERLYNWSPDEAIPQFYDDPSVFRVSPNAHEDETDEGKTGSGSGSAGLGDLRVPFKKGWGDDAASFVQKHRAILESDRVSHFLPKWIDLTFGVALFGERAVAEKNVMVPPADPTKPNANARVAVFFHPHPPRGGFKIPRNVTLREKDKDASFSSSLSSSLPSDEDDASGDDPTAPALRGDDLISLTGTPYAAPDALKRALAPGPHFSSSQETIVTERVASFESDCRADASMLGRLFAAVYSDSTSGGARGKQEDKARDARARLVADPTHPVDVNALPSAARAIVRGLLRSGAAAPDDDDDEEEENLPGEENGDSALTVSSALNSTFFSPSVRAAAAALSILHGGGGSSPLSDDSPLATVRAARAALASCASDVDATALVAPAAAKAAREAIGKLFRKLSTGKRSKRFAKKIARLIGSVCVLVSRRAPKAVAREFLPPLFRDALFGTTRGDAEDESESDDDDEESESESDLESESESASESESRDSMPSLSPKTREKVAREILRREMLRPAVLRAARKTLGEDFYALSIRDAFIFACLRPGCSRRSARAAALALEAESELSETPVPLAVREIFSRGLLRRLSYGEPVAFAVARVGSGLGQVNFNKFVAPALVRALGRDAHLDTVASAARRAAERFETISKEKAQKLDAARLNRTGNLKDGFRETGGDDDEPVTPAAAVAAAEGSACKGGWSLTPMRRRSVIAGARIDFSRESGALAALKATLHQFDCTNCLSLLFPAFPAPPGPLLRILLAPAPYFSLCAAAAELVAAAIERLAPDDVFKRALPRLKPLFAVAAQVSDEEEDLEALTLAFKIYPALGEKISFRALRDSVPDANALEKRFARRFHGWTAENRADLLKKGRVFVTSGNTSGTLTPGSTAGDPYSWLPAPDVSELEADETRRIGATIDDDGDDHRGDDDDDAPWALRLETLCSWRAHPSFGAPSDDAGSSFPGGGAGTGVLSPSDAASRGRGEDRWKKKVSSLGVSAFASSADERWLATCGAGDENSASSVVKVWSAGGPRRLRDRRDGDDVIDALAPCFATHDAHEGRVTCLTFLDGTGGVALAASADDAGAVHVWRADTGALLSRVREPGAAGAIKAPRFADSREAASGGWEARARAIERRKRIAAAIMEQTRDDDDDDDDDASRVSSDDGDGDALASSRDALSPSFSSRRLNRVAPRRETSASSDMLLDELSGPELGDLIGDDVLGDGPRRRRVKDAGDFFGFHAPNYSPKPAGLFGYGASDGFAPRTTPSFTTETRSTGYICLASTPDPREIALGTNDGRIRFVDLAREEIAGSWLCDASRGGGGGGTPEGVEVTSSSDAITSVLFFGAGVTGVTSSARALASAGARSGAVSFLDRRGGRLVAGFRAHDDAVVAMASRGDDGGRDGRAGSPYLVTASRDKTVCVWDVRMLTGASFRAEARKKKTPLLSKFAGFGDGVRAMATRGADAFVVAGEKLSVFSLDERPTQRTERLNESGVYNTHDVQIPVAPLRLRAQNGAKVRAKMTGVQALPRSRLFAVTGEDGKVRVCR